MSIVDGPMVNLVCDAALLAVSPLEVCVSDDTETLGFGKELRIFDWPPGEP